MICYKCLYSIEKRNPIDNHTIYWCIKGKEQHDVAINEKCECFVDITGLDLVSDLLGIYFEEFELIPKIKSG
ncbi:MAG: hypothetical protein PHP92_05605 [Candidatus Nanoarchaeia archaeon]|nr:hypothetical protein [Candidatus Nanoarchaeia archaeon]